MDDNTPASGRRAVMPAHPYDHGKPVTLDDLLFQIRHLAALGIAAHNTTSNLRFLEHSLETCLELIWRLADEAERMLDERAKG